MITLPLAENMHHVAALELLLSTVNEVETVAVDDGVITVTNCAGDVIAQSADLLQIVMYFALRLQAASRYVSIGNRHALYLRVCRQPTSYLKIECELLSMNRDGEHVAYKGLYNVIGGYWYATETAAAREVMESADYTSIVALVRAFNQSGVQY